MEREMRLPPPMAVVASKGLFTLYEIFYETKLIGNEWRNFKLERRPALKIKDDYWIGWNGERLSYSRHALVLQIYEPDIFNWVVEVFGGDPDKSRQKVPEIGVKSRKAIPKPPAHMTLIAAHETKPFGLYRWNYKGTYSRGRKWQRYNVRRMDKRFRKSSWWFKSNGKRLSKSKEIYSLLENEPDIYDWVVNSLHLDASRCPSRSQPEPSVIT